MNDTATGASGGTQRSFMRRLIGPAMPRRALAGIALWVVLLAFPDQPRISLDCAWQQGIIYALKHRLQAGVDYIFTVGPLGFCINLKDRFLSMPFDHDMFYFQMAWEMAASALTVVIIMDAARGKPLAARRVLAAFAVFALPLSKEALYLFALVAGAVAVVRRGARATLALATLVVFAAAIALTKFTLTIMAAISIAAVTLALWRRSKVTAAVAAVAFAALFLVGWSACGQSLRNLPPYLVGSLEIAGAHSEAMAGEGPFYQVALALAMLAGAAVLAALSTLRRPLRLARFVAAFVAGAGLFMAWKAGFVRHDVHAIVFFAAGSCIALVIPAPRERGIRRAAFAAVLLAVAVIGAAGLFQAGNLAGMQYTPPAAVLRLFQRVKTNVSTLAHPAAARSARNREYEALAASVAMPLTAQTVGSASIDVFSYGQQLLFLNNLNWRPRPVFQSNLASTPWLTATNAAFFDSAKAPDYVLLALQPLDSHFPTIEDNAAIARVLAGYSPLFVERGHLLLKRAGIPPAPQAQLALLDAEAPLNERIEIGKLSDGPQTLSVDAEFSLLGKLRTFLYRAPLVGISVTLDQGETETFRLPMGMARTPFVVNPFIGDQGDLIAWYSGKPLRRVTSIEIRVFPDDLKYIKPNVRVRVARLGFSLKGFPAGRAQ